MCHSKYARGNSCKLPLSVIAVLFVVFVLCDLLLFHFLFERQQRSSQFDQKLPHLSLPSQYLQTLHKYFVLVNNEWRIKFLPYQSGINNLLKRSAPTNRIQEQLNCTALMSVTNVNFIATGWTKASYRVNIGSEIVALKLVNPNGHDVSTCVAQGQNLWHCYMNAAAKLLQEIVRLKNIHHQNVIKVLGYCIPEDPVINNNSHAVSLITEFGEPINVIRLLQMSWEDRLRISLGLAKLLKHLSQSPLGPISLNDFRRQQFVLVEGVLKLVDVDDVGIKDPTCETEPCCISSENLENGVVCVPCVKSVCLGYNEKLNILSAGKHFINYILPHGAPTKLVPLVNKIMEAYNKGLWTSNQILQEMNYLTELFMKGEYRNVSKVSYLTGYKIIQSKDLSSLYDYRCKLTVSGYGCTLSVFDAEEAAAICSSNSDCKAFVLTNATTWTGRKTAYFKNGVGHYLSNNNTSLYIKDLL